MKKSNVLPLGARNVGDEVYTVDLPVTALNPSVFNPPSRVDPARLVELMKSLKEDGQLVEVHVVHCPPKYIYAIADGHRRHAAAIAIGLETLRVRVHTTGTPEKLWDDLNKARPITPADRLCAYLTSNKRLPISGKVKRDIELTLSTFGEEWVVDRLVSHNMSMHITHQTLACMVLFDRYCSSLPVLTPNQVAEWILDKKASNAVRYMLTEQGIESSVLHKNARTVHKAIRTGQPIKRKGT